MELRPYQQSAVDSAVAWLKTSTMPGLLELATGAGKSHIIAAIAQWMRANTEKRVLVLQPSAELVKQNVAKYRATGARASIFSASGGGKCLRHSVVFATPVTVKNSMHHFGADFGLVIIDEAHGVTPTVKGIINAIRLENPRLRVLGLTATPYRLGQGFIYAFDLDARAVPSDKTNNPFFSRLLCSVQTRDLIDAGFLTPIIGERPRVESYDAGGLVINSRGQFDAHEVERVFEGQGRLTSQIVAEVVELARGRKGVLLFASTVAHAREVLASLPPELSAIVTGETPKVERARIIDAFKAMRIKYLVNVSVLTTGFDAPHVDLVAILRATESRGLLSQIIGRGMRLYPGKADCLLLDYAGNIERHGLQDDLHSVHIEAKSSVSGEQREYLCPSCHGTNVFSVRKEYHDAPHDEEGYLIEPDGSRVLVPVDDAEGQNMKPLPVHYGRRCQCQVRDPNTPGELIQCEYRYSSKICPNDECGHQNDISARYCAKCKAEIVDPNAALSVDFMEVRDPYKPHTERLNGMTAARHMAKSGNECVRVTFKTETRQFAAFFFPNSESIHALRAWARLTATTMPGRTGGVTIDEFLAASLVVPQTITYRMQRDSTYFNVVGYNLAI